MALVNDKDLLSKNINRTPVGLLLSAFLKGNFTLPQHKFDTRLGWNEISFRIRVVMMMY